MNDMAFVRAEEIIHRLRLHLPMQVTLPDPITGEEFRVDRKNVMNQLVLDVANLVIEAQTIPVLYMEFGRAHRAAERAAAQAELMYRSWKADMAMACRTMGETSGKKVTEAMTEEYYRTQGNYKHMSELGPYYRGIAMLFLDAKEAIQLKARMLELEQRHLGKTDKVLRTEDELSRLEDKLTDIIGSDPKEWELPSPTSDATHPAPAAAQAPLPALPVVPPPPAPPAAPEASGTAPSKRRARAS